MKKEERIHLRLTSREKKIIEENARKNKSTVSSYILNCVENNIVINIDTSDYRELAIQIKRIGHNINQIIRNINYNQYIKNSDVALIKNYLDEINEKLEKESNSIHNISKEFKNISRDDLKKYLEKKEKEIPNYMIYEEFENHINIEINNFMELIINEKLDDSYISYFDTFIKNFEYEDYSYNEIVQFINELDEALNLIYQKVIYKNNQEKLKDNDVINILNILKKYRKG